MWFSLKMLRSPVMASFVDLPRSLELSLDKSNCNGFFSTWTLCRLSDRFSTSTDSSQITANYIVEDKLIRFACWSGTRGTAVHYQGLILSSRVSPLMLLDEPLALRNHMQCAFLWLLWLIPYTGIEYSSSHIPLVHTLWWTKSLLLHCFSLPVFRDQEQSW